MAKCAYCGEETTLHGKGVPTCVNCDEDSKGASISPKTVEQREPTTHPKKGHLKSTAKFDQRSWKHLRPCNTLFPSAVHLYGIWPRDQLEKKPYTRRRVEGTRGEVK